MANSASAGDLIGGRYRLDRVLGAGGMGTVWAATHIVTRRTVALKLLRTEGKNEETLKRRFLREARAASAVRHPHVVDVHDVFELEDGSPVIVMDLLEGETLGALLARDRSLSLGDAARILLQVISAVGAAHALGIVHRDLKPENVFLERRPKGETQVRVLDFGIAKVLSAPHDGSETTGGITGTGTVLGTPYYMPPEQIYAEPNIDHRADIWALGVIAYECLAGERPFEGNGLGPLIKAITTRPPKPLAEVAPHLDKDVAALIDSMLRYNRAKRLGSLQSARAILERHSAIVVPEFGEPKVTANDAADEPIVNATESGRSRILPHARDETLDENDLASGETVQAARAPTAVRLDTLENAALATERARTPLRAIWIGAALATTVVGVGVFGWRALSSTRSSTDVASVPIAGPSATPAPSTAAAPSTPEVTTDASAVASSAASAPSSPSSSPSTTRPFPVKNAPHASAAPSASTPQPSTTATYAPDPPSSGTPRVIDRPPF